MFRDSYFFDNGILPSEKLSSGERIRSWCWVAFGLAALVLSIIVLERKQPYYFVQDDNFAQFLPVIVQGCRSFFLDGIFPQWNPYQFMGAPTTCLGIYALTYPPTYISYFLAQHLFRNEFLTLDIFCIMHMAAGYFATYWLLKENGLRTVLAVAGSLCFILSGYTLIAGRSWYYMVPVVVWAPLLFMSLTALKKRDPGLGWVIGTGLTIGIFFHAGNSQMWVYAMMFFVFAAVLLLWTGGLSLRRFLWIIPAMLLGLGIALPLLVPQVWSTEGALRFSTGAGIRKGLLAMLLPFPLAHAEHPNLWGNTFDRQHIGQFYYSGTLFYAVFLLSAGFAAFKLLFKWDKQRRKDFAADNIWLICAFFAFIFALGKWGGLWWVFSKLPFFNKFSYPFKFLHYVNLFMVLGAGLVIERWLRFCRKRNSWGIAAATAVCILIFYHVNLADASFYSYAGKPYPIMPEKIFSQLHCPRRVIGLNVRRSHEPEYTFSLKHDFATVFGLLAFDGYDPLLYDAPDYLAIREEFMANPLETAQRYGIKWIITDRRIQDPRHSFAPDIRSMERFDPRSLKAAQFLYKNCLPGENFSNFLLLEIQDSDALAFVELKPYQALPISFNGSGADIDVSALYPTGGRVVINVLWRPGIRLISHNQALKSGPDLYRRVVTQVPAGVSLVGLRYLPPWRLGLIAGISFLIGSLITAVLIKKFLKT